MTNLQIIKILREASLGLKHTYDPNDLRFVEINHREYRTEEFLEFKRDLIETGNKIKLTLLEYHFKSEEIVPFLKAETGYFLFFIKETDDIRPIIIRVINKKIELLDIAKEGIAYQPFSDFDSSAFLKDDKGEVIFFILFPYKSLVSEYSYDRALEGEKMTPVRRLVRLLSTEKRDITYILFYSVLIGLISLILPLGIQTTVELISGGVFFSSIYVLIGIVILGVMFAGVLQIVQISLVEYLQRKVFTKAALEFAFRIPKIKLESILGNYAPELVNRFFDVMTIQKGLPKLLIDLSSGVVQIFFGLLLLSLYHPFFIFFGLILVTFLFLIFYFTGPTGLKSSINESKYKYKVAQWLEELARALNSFKMAGNTDLPIKKTDTTVSNYLKYRKTHFSVLITQFSFIIFFKAAVTAGLLIMGTILVVSREITLGQFVAAEVIIILLLAAVEKIITYMDVVYDLLTAVDKIATVTDLPLEKVGGFDFPPSKENRGYRIQIKDLSYKYADAREPVLQNVNLTIESGERLCIAGPGSSGKTTLTNLMAGLISGYEGAITVNDYSMRDLDLTHLRDKIAKNISAEEIFDGTLLENVTIGKQMESVDDAVKAIIKAGLQDEVNKLKDGINTHIISGGKGFSTSMVQRLILARCLAKNPCLLILNDYFSALNKQDKLDVIQRVMGKEHRWTLVAVSNDPVVMSACDRVIVISEGTIKAEGKFDELLRSGLIKDYIE